MNERKFPRATVADFQRAKREGVRGGIHLANAIAAMGREFYSPIDMIDQLDFSGYGNACPPSMDLDAACLAASQR